MSQNNRTHRRSIALAALAGATAIPLIGAGAGAVQTPAATTSDTGIVWQAEQPVATQVVIHGHGIRDRLSPAEQQDLAQLASQEGWSAAEAISWYEPVPPFTELAAKLQQEYPDSFVESKVQWVDGNASAWLVFTERPDASVFARLHELPLDVEVSWGAPASKQQLSAMSGRILHSLRSHYSGEAATSINPHDWSITVTTEERSAITPAQLDSAVAAAGAVSKNPLPGPDGQPRPPVSVFHREADLAGNTVETTVQAGRNLNRAATPGSCAGPVSIFTETDRVGKLGASVKVG